MHSPSLPSISETAATTDRLVSSTPAHVRFSIQQTVVWFGVLTINATAPCTWLGLSRHRQREAEDQPYLFLVACPEIGHEGHTVKPLINT